MTAFYMYLDTVTSIFPSEGAIAHSYCDDVSQLRSYGDEAFPAAFIDKIQQSWAKTVEVMLLAVTEMATCVEAIFQTISVAVAWSVGGCKRKKKGSIYSKPLETAWMAQFVGPNLTKRTPFFVCCFGYLGRCSSAYIRTWLRTYPYYGSQLWMEVGRRVSLAK